MSSSAPTGRASNHERRRRRVPCRRRAHRRTAAVRHPIAGERRGALECLYRSAEAARRRVARQDRREYRITCSRRCTAARKRPLGLAGGVGMEPRLRHSRAKGRQCRAPSPEGCLVVRMERDSGRQDASRRIAQIEERSGVRRRARRVAPAVPPVGERASNGGRRRVVSLRPPRSGTRVFIRGHGRPLHRRDARGEGGES